MKIYNIAMHHFIGGGRIRVCGVVKKVITLFETRLLTVVSSSCRTWSYSLIATQKIIAVTSSKQWIHFFRSDLWPPTSNNLERETINCSGVLWAKFGSDTEWRLVQSERHRMRDLKLHRVVTELYWQNNTLCGKIGTSTEIYSWFLKYHLFSDLIAV